MNIFRYIVIFPDKIASLPFCKILVLFMFVPIEIIVARSENDLIDYHDNVIVVVDVAAAAAADDDDDDDEGNDDCYCWLMMMMMMMNNTNINKVMMIWSTDCRLKI